MVMLKQGPREQIPSYTMAWGWGWGVFSMKARTAFSSSLVSCMLYTQALLRVNSAWGVFTWGDKDWVFWWLM